jgi:hypothetical protein
LLIDLLTTMGWNVSKKIKSAGAIFEGIIIKATPFSIPSFTQKIVEDTLSKEIGVFLT